ncbi:MAG: 3-phosphoshikimate 1-carboxyvinyltransferase [Lachnospiraceae bacterium]|nr:3-phosphoshikimate 1-carboxyvinyltransferase [Lachnospiraceae bacterium]
MKITRAFNGLRGELTVPGDKSISHRSIMFGAISEGDTLIRGFLKSADCISTMECFKAMGVAIEEGSDKEGDFILVHGKGLHGLSRPESDLYCGNSGTTTRLISGILAGQDFESRLTGDESLSKRPMKRVTEPLTALGASIRSEKGNGLLPLIVSRGELHGGEIRTKVASAQVKSAILLSGLYADNETVVIEPALSRNHTELMLSAFGADITPGSFSEPKVSLRPGNTLRGMNISVPGDISSAAYFIGAALIVPGSEVLLKNVGINPTRDGILRVFKEMGADISLENERYESGEKTADLIIKHSPSLKGTEIGGDIIPALIDEIPLIAVVAALAEGDTVIKDAAELKVKESNRINLTVNNLKAMGADAEEREDGMVIHGGKPLRHAVIETARDHRIAMSFSVAALASSDVRPVEIRDSASVGISYPTFYSDLDSLK